MCEPKNEAETKTEDLTNIPTKDLLLVLNDGLMKRPAVLKQLHNALKVLEERFRSGSASDMPATDHDTRQKLIGYSERLQRSIGSSRSTLTAMSFDALKLRNNFR